MNQKTGISLSAQMLRGAVSIWLAAIPVVVHATTLWTGPSTNFTQFAPASSDSMIPTVALSRNANGPLFNTAAGETSSNFITSPADTEWAFGTLANYNTLSYQSFASLRNGNLAGVIVNQPMVLHLISEDIYLSLTFTAWGQHFAGGFSYTRSTPGAVVPPTPSITITNPVGSGGVPTYSAPANVKLGVNATVSSGTITNVTYFGNGSNLGSSVTAPFNFTTGSLTAGSYALKAVATAAGVSGTSAVVNISVVTPVVVTNSAPKITNGIFAFDYTANPGLRYVIQNSSNLSTWISLSTNTPTNSPVHFTDPKVPNGRRFYRVGRLPNP